MTLSTSARLASDPANNIRTMANFSKAAYAVQPWENRYINDPSPGADEAYQTLLADGWQPIDFDIAETYQSYSSSSTRFTATNKMENGYYTHANAAALVARSDDALVIAFRGTNDANEKGENDLDPRDQYHPDKDHWATWDSGSDSMTQHYRYYGDLFSQIESYLAENPSIQKVYVTGHSMGGAMAIEYMSNSSNSSEQSLYESTVFAAAPFIYMRNFLGFVHRRDYRDDARILQVEIAEDPVAESWDALLDNNRPGEVIRLYGNETLDTPDSYTTYTSRDENHSMDYYLEMANSIDQSGWEQVVTQASTSRVVDVYVGGEQVGSEFIVAEQDDVLSGRGFELIYGGPGNDQLTGNDGQNTLMGGDGVDTLRGGGGQDLIYGGAGADMIYVQGDDLIYGEDGIDVLLIDGQLSQYRTDTGAASGDYDMALIGSGDTVRFSGVERLRFEDTSLAVDLDGSAGTTAKVLGAVFGADAVSNKQFVGVGLGLLDGGMSDSALMELALTAAGAVTNEAVVERLFFNVIGSAPTPDQAAVYVALLDNGMSKGDLGIIAADHVLNTQNINLVGLAETGIEYI